ncbi:MAG: IS5 family transposase [Janthinobacterium lividum]
MPFKANVDRRHHIPKQRYRATNSAAYDAALRQRGSLTVWFTEEAIAAWTAKPRATRGRPPRYSELAIATALTLRAVFRLALRQTEGLIGSVLTLIGLDLAVPDHTTLSRRAETLHVPRLHRRHHAEPLHLLVDSTGLKLCGAGEWLHEKHGTKTRRDWRTLHIGTDTDTGEIVAATLTDSGTCDASQIGPLLDQVSNPVASFTADGAYDWCSVYHEMAKRHPDAAVVVPPRSDAVPSSTADTEPTQRDRHINRLAEQGRMGWQAASGYNWRALVEADVSRFKRVIGDGLRSRTDRRRATEVAIAVGVLNRMLDLGRPEYVRTA